MDEKLKSIPHLPGSYQMFNKEGVIIYVGKAKDLNKRVNSYFNREHTGKTKKMVSDIAYFEYIVASSELEAFLLEFNLIKKYDPKYNILLRDDKSYPYIEYVSKPYPELKVSRYLNIRKKDKKMLFGPYPNAYAAKRIVALINRLYPLKKCKNLGHELCLYYHINECLGYCVKNNLNQAKIDEMEQEILSFLNGNDKVLKDKIMAKINVYNEQLNFEASKSLKEDLDYIKIISEKQKMELHDYVNRDVFNYTCDLGYLSIEIFFIRNGRLLGHFSDIIEYLDNEEEIIENFIYKFYQKHEIPKEILIPANLNSELLSTILETKVIIPQKGTKQKLLDLVKKNSKINLDNKLDAINKEILKTSTANEELRNILNMPYLYRIESYDNSNLFGDYNVSGMVVFKDGKPSKNDYRKYKIAFDKNDDYHTMQNVLRRRFKEGADPLNFPELIIVDGGKNQINAVKEVIDELGLDIKVCGLKKDNHHNTESLLDSDLNEIKIDKHSNLFHYLTCIQDEVHRFAITYHKTIRSKGMYQSTLDEISGLGPANQKKLLKHFKTITNIKNASVNELNEIVNVNIANNIYNYFHNDTNK
ncbi:MAG: excinuclease ABC subunit UvrC [Bacilli bacterium]|nr:excinuclease ABC subunit UvrC [Bacilli bacterium]